MSQKKEDTKAPKEDKNAQTPAPSVNLKSIMELFNAASPEDRRSFQQVFSPNSSVSSTPPPPAPISELLINQTIMANILSTPVAQITAIYPTLLSTHRWYDGISALIGHLPSYPITAFATWTHPVPLLDHAVQARSLFQQFIDACPWAVHMAGILPTNASYATFLQAHHAPATIQPPVLSDTTSAVSIIMYFHTLKLSYYPKGGKLSLDVLLRDFLPTLQMRIDTLKYTQYDPSSLDDMYHLTWIYYSNFNHLVLNKHLLIDSVSKFRQPIASSKTAETEIVSRNKYISDFKMFLQSFESIWSTPALAYAALKKPFADNFASRHVSKRVETFIADCSDMNSLLRHTVRFEDDISHGIIFPKITPSTTGAASPPVAAGATAAATAATTAGSYKPEGRKAHAVSKKPLKDSICLNPTCNRTPDHITYKCDVPCAIPTCPTPSLPHPASACMLLRIKDLYVPYFKSCEVCSSTTLRPFPRIRSPTPKPRNLEAPWRPIPSIKFDTGANVLVSPFPLTDATLRPCDDVIHVATGATAPITSITSLGNQSLYIVPSFDSALVPQSAIEAQGALSVLYNNELQIFDVNNNPTLTAAITAATPITVSKANNGDYELSLEDIRRLFLSPPPPSNICHPISLPIQTASIARYYTSQFNNLRDLVLYWHVALDHANEDKMLSIVENKCIANLPEQLTTTVIRKYFKQLPRCIPCAKATLQQVPSLPSRTSPLPNIGTTWYMDFDKQCGSDDTTTSIKSLGGYSHEFNAIDFGSGRAFNLPVKGTANAVTYFEKLYAFNKAHSYVLTDLYVDSEFDTIDMRTACRTKEPPITLHIGIPHDHCSLGLVERLNRTMSESRQKKMDQPQIKPSYWALAYDDSIDMWNSSPTPAHPTISPYQLYDKRTPDALASPFLPWGTHIVGHIPLALQTTQSGRGKEYIYVGRDTTNFGAIQLLNPATNRVIHRRTFKVMGSHPVQQMAFTTPINLLFDPTDDSDDDIAVPLPISPPLPSDPPPTPALPEVNINLLHYRPLDKSDVHVSQRRYFDNINRSFAELADDGRTIAQWIIHSVVCDSKNSKALYYKYYDGFLPGPPIDVDDYEYSLCTIINRQTWARFDVGELNARAIKLSAKHKLPQTWEQMLRHPNAAELTEAFLVEHGSWVDHNCLLDPGCDPDTIPPELIGDLMLIWDVKYKPDGTTIDKWKCRIVFRGDHWINISNIPTYASSAESKGLLIFLALVATLDYDLWALDVKTAFLHGVFPPGVQQFVRAPHGVPRKYFPHKVSKLGKCVYGHPAASHQFEVHHKGVYGKMGFIPLRSTPSMYQIPATPTTDQVISPVITDDCVMAAPFGSKMKQSIIDQFGDHYKFTTQDPLININGCAIHRDRENRRIGITQPLFLDNMEFQYPLAEGESYPSVAFPYGNYMSAEDRTNQTIYLTPSDRFRYQKTLGEILWLKTFSKPEIAFAHQYLSRVTQPTLYDYNLSVRTIQYCIGTREKIRWLGGPYGPIITGTVDSSFACHPDLKGQSSWSVHIGGGGASIFESKKQSITADCSASCEASGTYMSLPDHIYASNILTELGFPQPTAIGIGQDNTSTIQIYNHTANKRKSRHMDLRYNIVRENIENNIIRLFYLPTDHMIADIGTKALSPAVFYRLRDYLIGHITLPYFLEYIQTHAPQLFDKTFLNST